MTPRSRRNNRPQDNSRAAADQLLSAMFRQAKARFGDAVKAFWFYVGDLCPGCMARQIGVIKMKGKDALAINAFIYRPRGVPSGIFFVRFAPILFTEKHRRIRTLKLHYLQTLNRT